MVVLIQEDDFWCAIPSCSDPQGKLYHRVRQLLLSLETHFIRCILLFFNVLHARAHPFEAPTTSFAIRLSILRSFSFLLLRVIVPIFIFVFGFALELLLVLVAHNPRQPKVANLNGQTFRVE